MYQCSISTSYSLRHEVNGLVVHRVLSRSYSSCCFVLHVSSLLYALNAIVSNIFPCSLKFGTRGGSECQVGEMRSAGETDTRSISVSEQHCCLADNILRSSNPIPARPEETAMKRVVGTRIYGLLFVFNPQLPPATIPSHGLHESPILRRQTELPHSEGPCGTA